MSTRRPFDLTGACKTVSLDIAMFPIAGLPLCDIPDMPDATMVVPKIVMPPAPIAPLPDCLCLDLDILTNTSDLVPSTPAPLFTNIVRDDAFLRGHVTKPIPDCCDSEYQLMLSMRLPCMPFSIGQSSFTSELWAEQRFTGGVRVTGEDCRLKFDFALKSPCIPFDFSTETTGHVVYTVADTPYRLKLTTPVTCALAVELALPLQCMPFGISPAALSIALDDSIAAPTISGNLRRGADCAAGLQLELDIKIPAMPVELATDASINTGRIDFTAVRIPVVGGGGGGWAVSLDISLPPCGASDFNCAGIHITGTGHVTYGDYDTDPALSVHTTKGPNCTLHFIPVLLLPDVVTREVTAYYTFWAEPTSLRGLAHIMQYHKGLLVGVTDSGTRRLLEWTMC